MSAQTLETAAATVAAAPFAPDGWAAALVAVSEISGGWGGQLIVQARNDLKFDSVAKLGVRNAAQLVARLSDFA